MPAPVMNARQKGMVTGKHLAIRLGLSIAVLPYVAAASVLAQAADSSFRILENGRAIGHAAVSVTRDSDGWRVRSTSDAGGSIGLEARRVDITYDASWRMRFLSMELARGQETRVIHVAVQGLRSRTDVVLPDREAGFGTHRISPGAIALPDYVFGAYQALAARVEALAPGTDIPLLLTPRGEVHATVDATRDEELRTNTGSIRARHVSLLVIRDVPTPIEIWVSNSELLKLELPLDRLTVVRSDISD